jgi:hypothetical protein
MSQMLMQQREVAASVAGGILDLRQISPIDLPSHAISIGATIHRGCPGMLRYVARSMRVKLRWV